MTDFNSDFQYAAAFMPEVKRIVGPLLLEESELLIDQTQAADLVVLLGRDIRIGCRVRRPGYADQYPWQFTVRSSRPTGACTELEKLINGWGDWLFYGHDAGDGKTLSRWMVVDLKSWRAHLIRERSELQKRAAWGKKRNRDGTEFVWFDASSFIGDPPLLVSCSEAPYGD